MLLANAFRLFFKVIKTGLLLMVIASILFITYRGNQPMHVAHAPEGMTYFAFMADRMDAARTVKPARCGWGMILTLATLGPIYSVVYTVVAVDPDGGLARMTAPDPNIARNMDGAAWSEIPGIWWDTVERLSWSMLGEPTRIGCQFRQVQFADK